MQKGVGMSIQLFEHNQIAYESAVTMLNEEGRAAVIHPTGTGKSFIAFKLAQDQPDARICWLSPSEYIFNTQRENIHKVMQKDACTSFENIRFLSYAKLMMNEDCIPELKPDYIILDEFHRCGAAEWGKSVQKLLEAYPRAKRLGLSATNIRYLDNQRDMAQEIFEGNIASEMTLGEAIARGILSAPKYIVALYSYEQELLKLEKQIAAAENEGLKSENTKLLEQLRRALANADGPDRIFYKYMQKKHGKYIVFCSDKEHMTRIKDLAGEWFHMVDPEPHIYTAYYNNPETSKDFQQFKEDQSEHLKLLYCIDMLNEGVHVDDIDGVILLRPTVSPIIYLQQIGRCLAAGSSEEPVIFDLVNNFDSLYCIDYLKQEMEDAKALMPSTYNERAPFEERFQILDESRDCKQLFRQLQANLSSAWGIYYQAAAQYFKENGHLKIPKSYVTYTGLTVGSWLQTQRRVYAGKVAGDLSQEKIQRLNDIGMIWDIRKNNWQEGYEALLTYYKVNGHTDVKAKYVNEDGFPLGTWVSNLRVTVKKLGPDQVLSEEQQNQLKAVGMIWDKNAEKMDTYLQAATEYRQQHGNLDVPAKFITESGLPLGRWLHYIKSGKNGEKKVRDVLSREQIARLNALGMIWDKDNITLWNHKFDLARAYYEEHGNLDIPVAYCVDNVKLGRWISTIRSKRKKPGSSGVVLDEERISALDSIGMRWE